MLSLNAAATPLIPAHEGYAFDTPRVLVQQRLFGLAHGVATLAAACVADPRYRESVSEVYSEWNERQSSVLERTTRELARYYFDDRAADAAKLDISRALKLPDRVTLYAGQLPPVCATFAEALRKPRYDLREQYRLQLLAARLEQATITESEVETCRGLLPESDIVPIAEAAAKWHATYDAAIDEARRELEMHWPNSQIEGTLPDWQEQARKRGQRGASPARCNALSEELLSAKANPDEAFAPRP